MSTLREVINKELADIEVDETNETKRELRKLQIYRNKIMRQLSTSNRHFNSQLRTTHICTNGLIGEGETDGLLKGASIIRNRVIDHYQSQIEIAWAKLRVVDELLKATALVDSFIRKTQIQIVVLPAAIPVD